MEFSTDIFMLNPNKDIHIEFNRDTIINPPTAQDVFFRAKQDELFQQYQSARIFLRETETEDWNHWFDECDPRYEGTFKLLFMQRMFETALIYYNIIVDLSWTLCYVSTEYALYKRDKTIKLNDFISIEDAYYAMRKTENLVTNPDIEGNPLEYLKAMCPEYQDSINLIIDFWRDFKDSSARKLYNYIKHKGKPNYSEIEKFRAGKLMALKINEKECPMDIRDVKMVIGLIESISDLKEFDDTKLFPYIEKLFGLLEMAIKPSEIII
ncbi:MAG: hypothetical protein RR851_15080 [Clostridium sp.]